MKQATILCLCAALVCLVLFEWRGPDAALEVARDSEAQPLGLDEDQEEGELTIELESVEYAPPPSGGSPRSEPLPAFTGTVGPGRAVLSPEMIDEESWHESIRAAAEQQAAEFALVAARRKLIRQRGLEAGSAGFHAGKPLQLQTSVGSGWLGNSNWGAWNSEGAMHYSIPELDGQSRALVAWERAVPEMKFFSGATLVVSAGGTFGVAITVDEFGCNQLRALIGLASLGSGGSAVAPSEVKFDWAGSPYVGGDLGDHPRLALVHDTRIWGWVDVNTVARADEIPRTIQVCRGLEHGDATRLVALLSR